MRIETTDGHTHKNTQMNTHTHTHTGEHVRKHTQEPTIADIHTPKRTHTDEAHANTHTHGFS